MQRVVVIFINTRTLSHEHIIHPWVTGARHTTRLCWLGAKDEYLSGFAWMGGWRKSGCLYHWEAATPPKRSPCSRLANLSACGKAPAGIMDFHSPILPSRSSDRRSTSMPVTE